MATRISAALRLLALLLILLLAALQVVAAPVKVVVIQDKTGSTNWTRTPQLTLEDFDAPISLLKRSSGELAFGLIRDSSNRGLVRLHIDPAPVPPAETARTGHVFVDMRAANAYRAARAQYQQQLAVWQSATEANIALFKRQIQPLLDSAPNARASDVFGAIRRADLLLSEPEAAGKERAHRWILVASDGQHNQGPAMANGLSSGARLVCVNSAGESCGSLERFKPLKMESISSGIRYLIETEMSGGDHATTDRR